MSDHLPSPSDIPSTSSNWNRGQHFGWPSLNTIPIVSSNGNFWGGHLWGDVHVITILHKHHNIDHDHYLYTYTYTYYPTILHYLCQVATFGVGACEEMHSFMVAGLQRLTTCSGIKWVFLFLNWGLQTLSAQKPFLVGWVGMGMVQNTHVLVLIIINMKKETNQRLMVEFHDSKSFMYLE